MWQGLRFVGAPRSRPAYLIVSIVDGVGQDEILHILEAFDGEPCFARASERNTFWLDRPYGTRLVRRINPVCSKLSMSAAVAAAIRSSTRLIPAISDRTGCPAARSRHQPRDPSN
jgi:hypothetical protein